MAPHTPGPWECHPAPYGWDVWANTPEQFRQWITPVTRLASPHKAIFDGSIEVDAETCAANARLIAAAPDYVQAAGLAIAALSFALERAAHEQDAVAAAQYSAAKAALIAADDKRAGRDEPTMKDVTPVPAAISQATPA